MGEKITITAIEMVYQVDRTLMQIDLHFEDRNEYGRVFIETTEFFKMLTEKKS